MSPNFDEIKDKGLKLSDFKIFLIFSAFLAISANAVLALILIYEDQDALGKYIDSISIGFVLITTVILFLIVPRIKDKLFRLSISLVAIGFFFQLIYMIIWFYYWQIAFPPGIPDVSIGDAFYLGSYVLWIGSTIPYLIRYRNLMSRNSHLVMMLYMSIGAIIILISSDYWRNAAISYGYDWFTTMVWLSYVIVPIIALSFPIAVALLYIYQGYGKGLMRYYWIYFLVPIVIISMADIIGGFYYVLQEGSVPGGIDDVLYITAYAVSIASASVIAQSRPELVTALPERIDAIQTTNGKLIEGYGYLIENEDSTVGYRIFASLVATNNEGPPIKGLILSRRHPDDIKRDYSFGETQSYWISSFSEGNTIDPMKLGSIADMIKEFLSENENGAILLDGFEALMASNDFKKIAVMLEQMKDFVLQHRGYLIMPVNPKAFNDKELSLIERDFKVIRPDTPIMKSVISKSSSK